MLVHDQEVVHHLTIAARPYALPRKAGGPSRILARGSRRWRRCSTTRSSASTSWGLSPRGQVIATSEPYETKAAAMAGIRSMRKLAPEAAIEDRTAGVEPKRKAGPSGPPSPPQRGRRGGAPAAPTAPGAVRHCWRDGDWEWDQEW